MIDNVNAFVKTFELPATRADGPLQGLRFAAKDNYDIAGEVTGYGNPDWARTHAPAQAHARVVSQLLAAGASLCGKTHTDELAYSLMGVNAHYGTPVNTAAPDRIPGGSSSGSAAATAAGLADFAIGSDTGGSVRLPASFCGIYGMRPTHGNISKLGLLPLAPSFDTVGWFARDAVTLGKVGAALGLPTEGPHPVRILLPVEAWEMADPQVAIELEAVVSAMEKIYENVDMVRLHLDRFSEWRDAFRICQGAEIWEALGPWIAEAGPSFGPGVRERFEVASKITQEQWTAAKASRAEIADTLNAMLGGNTVIVLPTSPSPAPKVDAGEQELESFRLRSLQLLCSAGLGGLPQVSLPAGIVEGGPVGLSIVGARNADGQLLDMARTLEREKLCKAVGTAG